jgi:hypothetical protein
MQDITPERRRFDNIRSKLRLKKPEFVWAMNGEKNLRKYRWGDYFSYKKQTLITLP